MELKIDLTKKYGIVLEGGGAKGAYQIGAWKALKEAGVQIESIAGASVGSLNGALMCMDDLEKAEKIWSNICYSDVLNVQDEFMVNLKSKNFRSLNLSELLANSKQLIKDRGFDITPLKNLIEEVVDEDKIRSSGRALYVTTYSLSDRKELAVDLNHAKPGTMKDMLLASAYFLAFKNEKLQGKRYMDGGGFNNVPLDILLDRGYKDIIVIRIYGWGFDSEKVVKVPDDANVYHIAPRQDLGGILEFEKKQARKNMTLGYFDAQRFLYGLAGRTYYIDAPGSEAYYFDKMMSELELLKCYMEKDLDQETFMQLKGYRPFTEVLFPKLAEEFKLKEGWDYKDFYIALLEDLARRMKFKRFKVYTVDELVKKIQVKLRSANHVISI